MAEPLIAGLPPFLQLGAGYQMRLQALDPATGLTVAGVKVANVSLFVQNAGGGSPEGLAEGPFLLVTGAEG